MTSTTPPVSPLAAQQSEQSTSDLEQLAQLLEANQVGIWDVAAAAAVIVVAFPVARMLRRLVRRIVRRSDRFPEVARDWAGRMAYFGVLALALVSALNLVGLNTTPIVVLLVLAAVVTFETFRPIMENSAAGILLDTYRPISVGDQIHLSGHVGVVREMNTHDVVIATPEGSTVRVPNSDVFASTIVNDSRTGGRRTDISLVVSSGTDLRKAREVLAAAVTQTEGVHEEPAPEVLLTSLVHAGIEIEIRYFRASALIEEARTRDKVIEAIDTALRHAGIDIPYPQAEVRILPQGNDNTHDHSTGRG